MKARLGDGTFGVYEPQPLRRTRALSLRAAVVLFFIFLAALAIGVRPIFAAGAALLATAAHALASVAK